MKRSIRLRAQSTELPERRVRLRIPGQLGAELDEYREMYAQVHGHEIELPALIEGILEQFLDSDRAFQRARKGSAQRRQSVVPSAEDPS